MTSDAPLATGSPVEAGAATIGTIGSTSVNTAIAMLRLDRAAEAIANGTAIHADAASLRLDPPDWIRFDLATGKPSNTDQLKQNQ